MAPLLSRLCLWRLSEEWTMMAWVALPGGCQLPRRKAWRTEAIATRSVAEEQGDTLALGIAEHNTCAATRKEGRKEGRFKYVPDQSGLIRCEDERNACFSDTGGSVI